MLLEHLAAQRGAQLAAAEKSFACDEKAAPPARLSELDASDRLQPRARIDFRLRQKGGLLPEALNQRTHELPYRRRGHQYRRLAFAGGLFKAVAHHGHELRQF